ncbi:7-cyano-7-deazaguanine synthase QueC [Rhodopila sp.]|uniref:7-cyano-7-deazaguanine synthase QueC n=1 Tax=Rhodopila sp. TaxID=2480087 RepID=UPI003D095C8D
MTQPSQTGTSETEPSHAEPSHAEPSHAEPRHSELSHAGDAALVLFSGGQDSATCLAWALARYGSVETVGFRYGQRHAVELACREPIRSALASPGLGPDHLVDLTATIAGLGQTAMTADVAIEMDQGGLPNTFVPGRNLLFLTCAAAIAYRRGLRRIVAGVCETDYSGYPDCRDDTVKAMQLALNLGMQRRFVLETPLMWRDKAATWALAFELGGDALVGVIRESSHTCYLGDRSNRHEWGFGCGTCPACLLRAQGWQRWMADGGH